MATTGRQFDPDLNPSSSGIADLLRREPFRVGFFQAVRLLRRLFPHRAGVGQFVPPASEAVRFLANPSLAFPASEIQETGWPENSKDPVAMRVNFMGLSSPQGVLPAPYTELILERSQKKNHGLRDFFDIFNHRVISLFYRAWEKYRFFIGYERREPDTVTPLMLSFLGIGTAGLAQRLQVPDQALIFYAGILAQKPRSAQSLRQILASYFQVDVEIEQFVGKWVKLGEGDQTRFDDSDSLNQQLGMGAIVGDEIWDQQSTVRIRLGPLTRDQYLDFLPGKDSRTYAALKSLLQFYSSDQIDFEVQLVLDRDVVPGFQLGEDQPLGWMTWIRNAPLERDPQDAVLPI